MAISSMQDIADRAQQGRVVNPMMIGVATGTITGAAGTSGGLSMEMFFNSIGTTLHSTLVDVPYQAGLTDQLRLISLQLSSNRQMSGYLARFYKIGTLDLTTGTSEFTHDSATFPVTRTVYGQASQPVTLLPIMLVTTALTTTATQFTMDYTDQDGNSTTGSITHTMPSATTAVGSCLLLPLELDDSGVRDVTNINITTTSATGAATIYGVELIAQVANLSATTQGIRNTLVKGLTIPSISPAVATSGTATSLLTYLNLGTNATTTGNLTFKAYRDN